MAEQTDWRERIVCEPAIHHGEPVIRGTRIAVAVLVASLTDYTIDQLLQEYPQLARIWSATRALGGPPITGIPCRCADCGEHTRRTDSPPVISAFCRMMYAFTERARHPACSRDFDHGDIYHVDARLSEYWEHPRLLEGEL